MPVLSFALSTFGRVTKIRHDTAIMSLSRTDFSQRRLIPVFALALIVAAMVGVTFSRNSGKQVSAPVTHTPNDEGATSVPDTSIQQVAAPEFDPAAWKQERDVIKAEQARKAQGERRELMQRYAGENLDPAWAAAKEATMLGASTSIQIEQLDAEPEALDINCKATMCRIEADFASSTLAQDWFTLFSTALGAEMPHASFQYSREVDGSVRVVVYGIARKK
jgi:hypothetical protein